MSGKYFEELNIGDIVRSRRVGLMLKKEAANR